MSPKRAILFGLIGAAVVAATAFAVDRALLADLRAKADRAETLARDIARYEEAVLAERRRANTLTRELSPLMLPGDADRLQHQFRALLAELAGRSDLQDATISSSSPAAVPSPMGNARVSATGLRRRLRAEPGVSVLRGSIRGVATLEQAFALLALADRQPWIHRVEAFELTPAERTRERFVVRLEVATIRIADVDATAEPVVLAANNAEEDVAGRLATRLAFRPPEPPPPTPPVRVEVPEPPRPPEYDAWRVSAIVERSAGVEVWLVRDGGASRTLLPGDALAGAVLQRASARSGAVFEIEGVLYRVPLGGGLRERQRVERDDVAGSPEGGVVASGGGE